MSYYYTYYLGYEREGKIYPLGPYDCFGKLRDVVNRSRSFASDLHERFWPVKEEEISDELRKEFEYTDWEGKKTVEYKIQQVKVSLFFKDYDKAISICDNIIKETSKDVEG